MTDRLSFTRHAEPFPCVTVGDVAARSGQKVDTVKHWVLRNLGTPQPIGYSVQGAIYWWPDWVEWFHVRRPAVYEAMGNGTTPDSEGKG